MKFPAATPTVPSAVGFSVTSSSGIGDSVADPGTAVATVSEAVGLSVSAEGVSSAPVVDSPSELPEGSAGVALGDGVTEVSARGPVSSADCSSSGEGEADGEGVGEAESEAEGEGVGDSPAGSLTTGAPVTSSSPSTVTTSPVAMPVAGATSALCPSEVAPGAIRQVTTAWLSTTALSGAARATLTG